jgi:hypothetical protein
MDRKMERKFGIYVFSGLLSCFRKLGESPAKIAWRG